MPCSMTNDCQLIEDLLTGVANAKVICSHACHSPNSIKLACPNTEKVQQYIDKALHTASDRQFA